MTEVHSIVRAEIDAMWAMIAGRLGISVPDGHVFEGELQDAEARAVAQALISLEPWLSILPQGIHWLTCTHISMEMAIKRGVLSDDYRVPTALIGAACTYATAVRRLVLSGLDAPARGMVRALSEMLHVAIATLFREDLRLGMRKAHSFEIANAFWYKHLRARQLQALLDEVERSLGVDAAYVAESKEIRESEISWLSMYIHPTYLAAEMACMPSSAAEPGTHRRGLLGHCSGSSVHTLDRATKSIWYFASAGGYQIFGHPKLYELDATNEIDLCALYGADVFRALVIRHWEDHEDFEHEREEAATKPRRKKRPTKPRRVK